MLIEEIEKLLGNMDSMMAVVNKILKVKYKIKSVETSIY
jgi:hypothetical protein